MKKSITLERWREAQEAERMIHNTDVNNTFEHYRRTYAHYFKAVGLGTNLYGLSVTEVGPADHPALMYCSNYSQSCIIEPMPSNKLSAFCASNKILLFKQPVELIEEMPPTNEYWLFNVMQHIIDPDVFIDKIKRSANRIRFFEPINYPTSTHHPHEYTHQDFTNWFGDCAKFYKGGSIPGFHESDCAYGVYIKP